MAISKAATGPPAQAAGVGLHFSRVFLLNRRSLTFPNTYQRYILAVKSHPQSAELTRFSKIKPDSPNGGQSGC